MASEKSYKVRADMLLAAVILLVSIVVALLIVWAPWSGDGKIRTIKTTGTATISAAPDEYNFNPSYRFTGDTETEVNDLVAKKTTEVVDGLKGIGVADSKIKVNANAYESYYREPGTDSKLQGYLYLNVVADNKDFAQTISDYLLTTGPQGSITPQATFSEAKQKEVQADARTAAIADARKSAERTAKDVDAKLGKIQSVSDGQSGNYNFALDQSARAETSTPSSGSSSIPIQAGENKLSFTVEVVFELK